MDLSPLPTSYSLTGCISQWLAIVYLILLPGLLAILAFLQSVRVVTYTLEDGGHCRIKVLGGFITVQEDWIAPGQLDASELDDKNTTGHEIHSMAFINASAREEQLYVVEKYQNERERIAAPIAGLFCFVKAINWCELIYIGNMIPHALLTRFVYRNYDARRIGLPYLSLCVVHQAVGIASLCVDYRTALIALRTVYFPYVATDVRGLVFLSLLVVGFGLVFGIFNGIITGISPSWSKHASTIMAWLHMLAILFAFSTFVVGCYSMNRFNEQGGIIGVGTMLLAPFFASLPIAYVRLFKFVASILLVVGIASFATGQRYLC